MPKSRPKTRKPRPKDIEKILIEEEQKTFEDDDSTEVPPQDIIAYNELRSCADLYRMYKRGILEIQPNFQREIVWPNTAQTRFVDSLIKQLPIPSMCFSLDYKTEKWLVIDGLQRMATIIKVLSGQEDWTLSKLDDINPKISGQEIKDFHKEGTELHELLVRIENLTLPITVLRSDYSKRNHTEYIFTIFHRLNSGGLRLTNQEIRNCIFSGPFNDLLNNLNQQQLWLSINRMSAPTGYRFRGQELILRFFAFSASYKNYTGKLAKFLNDYMDKKRAISEHDAEQLANLFNQTIRIIHDKLFNGDIPTISTTLLEGLMVGINLNLANVEKISPRQLRNLYMKLVNHKEYSTRVLSEGISAKQRVIARMAAAGRIFATK